MRLREQLPKVWLGSPADGTDGKMEGQIRPKISVIVPSYNKPQYLPECLQSIQAQTFTNWECIVVDDCSPRGDEIRAAVEGMGDARFRLVRHHVNRGPAASRNTGVRCAEGKIVVFVDEDDRIMPEYLATTVPILCGEGDGLFVCTTLQRFGNETRLKQVGVRSLAEDVLCRGVMPPAGGLVLWKRDFLRIGGFDESEVFRIGHEDTDFWLRAVLNHGFQPKVVEKPLYFWRATGNSLSARLQSRSHVVRQYLLRRYLSRTGTPIDRARFLATGYKKASYYHLQRGETGQAILLRCGYCYYQIRSEPFLKSLRELLSFVMEAVRKRAMTTSAEE